MVSRQDTIQGYDMYQLGATTNKPPSDDESYDEYEEYREAFEEFECKCPEQCEEMDCFNYDRGDFKCPICHEGGDWWWPDFMYHRKLAHGTANVYPGKDE